MSESAKKNAGQSYGKNPTPAIDREFERAMRGEAHADLWKHIEAIEEEFAAIKSENSNLPAPLSLAELRSISKMPDLLRQVSRSSDFREIHDIDAAVLDAKLERGVLRGKGAYLIRVAKEAGVDPAFMAAIVGNESGWGTSPRIRRTNNPGGLTNSSGAYAGFATPEKALSEMARYLRRRYYDYKISTKDDAKKYGRPIGDLAYRSIEEVAGVYAPPGAGNDPLGLNGGWPGMTTKLMNELIVETNEKRISKR